jgi:hypothetical protein
MQLSMKEKRKIVFIFVQLLIEERLLVAEDEQMKDVLDLPMFEMNL